MPLVLQPYADRVGPHFTFVGPCLGDRPEQGGWRRPPGAERMLLVSLGSAYTDRSIDVAELRGRTAAVRVRPVDDDAAALLADVLRRAGATVTDTIDGLDARGVPPDRIGRLALEHGIALCELAPHRSGLEESFFALTAGTQREGQPA